MSKTVNLVKLHNDVIMFYFSVLRQTVYIILKNNYKIRNDASFLFRFCYNIFNDVSLRHRIHLRHLTVFQPFKTFPAVYTNRRIFFLIFPEHCPQPEESVSRDCNIFLKSILILGY